MRGRRPAWWPAATASRTPSPTAWTRWNGPTSSSCPGTGSEDREDPPRAVVEALIAAHERGARLAAISTGAFALAATGLLDGRRATTHWHYTRALKARHPRVRVDENVLFVDEGSVLTSAGAASGIDLCLHILRGDLGVAASNHAARRLVAAPYRSGGQAQYVPRSVPEPLGERFAATREWALHRLDDPLTLDVLARQAGVSPRTFSRRFVEETGYTPMQWVMRARVDLARELLERSQRSVEQIAADTGLGTGANLRLHFQRILGTTPSEYRRTFTRGSSGALVGWRDTCEPWRSRHCHRRRRRASLGGERKGHHS